MAEARFQKDKDRDAGPSRRSLLALDALNVVLADVRDGLGPYLAIYLASVRHWDAARIGIAMLAMGIAQVAAQTPAGALIDYTRRKRLVLGLAAAVIAAGSIAMVTVPSFAVILGAQAILGASSAAFAPALAAVSLGLVGHAALARRMGRNEAFNHAGNVLAAVLAGAIGDLIAYEGIFYLLAGMCLVSIAGSLLIRGEEIDYELARGGEGTGHRVAGLGELLRDRRLATFALAAVLFHFANAAMLPLVGQKLTAGRDHGVAGAMSACIIAAQVVMVPVALLASRLAETWGRKPVFLLGFAILPVRGILYTFSTNPYFLVAVQLLDGIGAGIFGVVSVLVVADLTRGTGRFNVTQGALATAVGLGASLSNLMTGFIVRRAGFDVGFLTLAAIAAAACLFYAVRMPETGPSQGADRWPTSLALAALPE
ncbi:MAG: MFS transporter [Isosphaeraceae bacterium]|nr:MFS transporter [Isosphaeraceae bacterium]